MTREIVIHLAGASRGHPGPAGFGLVVRPSDGPGRELSEPLPSATLRQAECHALLRALRLAWDLGYRIVHVHSDRPGFFGQLQEKDPVRDTLLEEARRLAARMEVHFHPTRRAGNSRADWLARQAMEASDPRGRGRIPPEDAELSEALQHSAGGVVYKKEGGTLKVCLIAKRGGQVWALPKGRVDPGETPEQAALREVLEETGNLVEIGELVDEIDYDFYWKENRTLYHKRVAFYLMPLVREGAAPPDGEADAVAWFTLGEAYRRLSYLNEKDVLRQARRILQVAGA